MFVFMLLKLVSGYLEPFFEDSSDDEKFYPGMSTRDPFNTLPHKVANNHHLAHYYSQYHFNGSYHGDPKYRKSFFYALNGES